MDLRRISAKGPAIFVAKIHIAMKRLLLFVIAATIATQMSAQSLNILNYSGKMYITKFDILSTPRYVSYEDHAILSQDLTIPVTKVTTINLDFENNIYTSNESKNKIVSKSIKEYSTDMGWNVVISIRMENDPDLYELVWQEYGNPYFQEITKSEEGVKICRMQLSTKPSSTSPEDALIQFLGGYGKF